MNESISIKSRTNRTIQISAIPGHFATGHSHVNYYIDITKVKHEHIMARNAGIELASEYANTPLDTIICMDGSEVIGSFIARELTKSSYMLINEKHSINVLPPEYNTYGQMIFRDNLLDMVANKQTLLLIASITTGKTAKRALECVSYYGGEIVGVSAVFSALDQVSGIAINSIFSLLDIPDYKSYSSRECPLCQSGNKIDALANSYGYSVIR